MNTTLIELRPNRNYLDPNFNGYKLSLANVPIIREELSVSVDQVFPSKDQYTFLHAKLFSLHNYLIGETYQDSTFVYFIDENLHLQKVNVNLNSISNSEVWQVPNHQENVERTYYVSIKFASKTIAILTDGSGILYILNTGDRNDDSEWQSVFDDYVLEDDKPFIIQDVIYKDNKLHCLLFTIEQQNLSSKHLVVFHLITLIERDDKSWDLIASRQLTCKGDFYYAYLAKDGSAIYSVTASGLELLTDSENPITTINSTLDTEINWSQTPNEIILKLDCEFDDVNIRVDEFEIQIKCKDSMVFEKKLCHKVKSNSVWTIENKILEVTLHKEEEGLMWTHLTEDTADKPEFLEGSTQRTEESEQNKPLLSRLQLEECDRNSEDLAVFERFSINSQKVTHRASIGSNQVLLTTQMEEDQAPAMAIRYDVDACLWQPLENENDFILKHEGTLLAFGYVQASKQQKKFSVCAPNLSYSVVCEATRHLFIYKHNSKVNTELRNRKSGKHVTTVCQQHVVSLSDDNILGIYATNTTLILLTENSILIVRP